MPFDSDISINFRFIPLLKDLNLGTIESRLIEKHHVTKPFSTTRSREVLVDKYVPPNWDNWDIVSSDDESSHFWYHCSRVLHLPKSTRHCLQSATSTVIQVEHQIEIVITLLNPDSHVSSVRQSHFLFIYIERIGLTICRSVFLYQYSFIFAHQIRQVSLLFLGQIYLMVRFPIMIATSTTWSHRSLA